MERTMKKGTERIIFVVFVATLGSKYLASCDEIFSQIDFDSRENVHGTNTSGSNVFLNLNDAEGRAATASWNSKPTFLRLNSDNAFVRSGNVKRSYFVRGDSTKEPNVINNVRIVISGNETKPGIDECKNGVCKVSVSSKLDEEGNIVTDVHLNIVTKLETVNDIPVIDGVRGVTKMNETPDLGRVNTLRLPIYLNNDIPQIQTRYRGGEPWYQGRRTFQRPQGTWQHHYPVEAGSKRFQGRGMWPSRMLTIDDKIDLPLSKTNE